MINTPPSPERIPDIAPLISLAQRLRLPALLDRHLGTHGLHQGLSNGWLAAIWSICILTEGDHRKSNIQEWVAQHQPDLQRLLRQPIRAGEFSGGRLGIVLRRLSHIASWKQLEADLWESTAAACDVRPAAVRLDSFRLGGYGADATLPREEAEAESTDSEMPPLQLLAAAAEPAGYLLACDVQPYPADDEPHFLPLIRRVRSMLDRPGLLFVSNSPLSAIATRAQIIAHGDHYLAPLALQGELAAAVDAHRESRGMDAAEPLGDRAVLPGSSREFIRIQRGEAPEAAAEWRERVQVTSSPALADQQAATLAQHLEHAEAALRSLTPPPARGKRQFKDEAALQAAIRQILEQHDAAELLRVTCQREEQNTLRYVGRGRGGPTRPVRTETRIRYVITEVRRDEAALQRYRAHLGWQVQATSLPPEALPLAQAVLCCRNGWSLERDVHRIIGHPADATPLYVRRDDQVIGLIRLLSLCLRLLALSTMPERGAQA